MTLTLTQLLSSRLLLSDMKKTSYELTLTEKAPSKKIGDFNLCDCDDSYVIRFSRAPNALEFMKCPHALRRRLRLREKAPSKKNSRPLRRCAPCLTK